MGEGGSWSWAMEEANERDGEGAANFLRGFRERNSHLAPWLVSSLQNRRSSNWCSCEMRATGKCDKMEKLSNGPAAKSPTLPPDQILSLCGQNWPNWRLKGRYIPVHANLSCLNWPRDSFLSFCTWNCSKQPINGVTITTCINYYGYFAPSYF